MQQAPHHTIPYYTTPYNTIPHHTCYKQHTTQYQPIPYHTTLYHTCCHIAGSISRLCRMLSNVGSSLPCQLPTKTTLARFSNVSAKRVLDHSHFLIAFCLLSEQWFCLRRNERRIILSAAPKDSYDDRSSIALLFIKWPTSWRLDQADPMILAKWHPFEVFSSPQNCQRGVVIIG